MMTPEEYTAKREARYQRLLLAAERAQEQGDSRLNTGNKMFSIIPMGQPILIGHYSERRDRNYRERARNNISKGYELHRQAEELRQRSESVKANNAIFSDDPQATEKLEEKIARLEARQERMKEVNKLVRKEDRDGLSDLGYTENEVIHLLSKTKFGGPGYASFELTNNNANIKRLKDRLKIIEKKQAAPDRDLIVGYWSIEYRPSENRIRLHYTPGRTDRETFLNLKRHGYRVLRSEGEGCFSAYYNFNAGDFINRYIKPTESTR